MSKTVILMRAMEPDAVWMELSPNGDPQVGDVWRINGELMRVTSRVGRIASVDRGADETKAVVHSPADRAVRTYEMPDIPPVKDNDG